MNKKLILQAIFGITAICCFGYIILQPLWNPNAWDTCLVFLLGWTAARYSNSLENK